MKRPNLKALQREVDAFNAKNPIGTRVAVFKDAGNAVETITSSRAEILSGHSAVIWLEGISGCYLLERVRALEPA